MKRKERKRRKKKEKNTNVWKRPPSLRYFLGGVSHDACNPSVGRHRVYFKSLKRRRLARKTKCCEVKNGSSMRAGLDERATDEEMSKVYECALPFALSLPFILSSPRFLLAFLSSFLRFPTSLTTRSSILFSGLCLSYFLSLIFSFVHVLLSESICFCASLVRVVAYVHASVLV